MTTGMRNDQTTRRPIMKRRVHWVWPVVALIIVALLIGWAYKTSNKSQNNNANTPSATSTSVQQGATGQQGAVGGFAEKVVPNPGGQSQNSIGQPTGPSNLGASGTSGTAGTSGSNGQGSSPTTNSAGAGAGNTGITTATDNMGGAAVQSGQSTKGSKQASPAPSGTTHNDSGPGY